MNEKAETFKIATRAACRLAEEKSVLCYVCHRADYYYTSFKYEKGWLFKAYPGGRKELSVEGSKVLQS